jgi:uncharacterized membrane protein YwzB
MRNTAITAVIIVVIIAAIVFLAFRSHNFNTLLKKLYMPSWYFADKNMLGIAANTSNDVVSFPIAYLAFVRTTFENQEEIFNTYKPYLRAGDYISTISISPPNPAQNVGQLPFSNDKMKGVTYFSLDEIKNNIKSLKQKGVSFVGYDLESEGSPATDLSHPVASMRDASKVVHQYGLKFLAIPGYPFDTYTYVSQFAPYADIYIIQAQSNESQPSIYKSYVIGAINALRAANPNARIITELSTNTGTLSEMKQSFSVIAQNVDGVTVWPESVKSLSKVKKFLEWYNNSYRR